MTLKRPIPTLAALSFGLSLGASLGACTQLSGTVADHWPHWAGGEPANLPPRPGSAGYEEYVAHRQAEGAAPAAASTGSAAITAPPAVSAQTSNPAPTGDAAVARGGLY